MLLPPRSDGPVTTFHDSGYIVVRASWVLFQLTTDQLIDDLKSKRSRHLLSLIRRSTQKIQRPLAFFLAVRGLNSFLDAAGEYLLATLSPRR
jgi:hypothetical protein